VQRAGVQLLPEQITSSDIYRIDKIADKNNNTEYYVTMDKLLYSNMLSIAYGYEKID
jgi:hypothetical protein